MDRVRIHLHRRIHCCVSVFPTCLGKRMEFSQRVFSYSVGVTQVDRPAAAPQTGPYDLNVIAVGTPGFVAGLTATINLFGKTLTLICSL